MKPSRLGVAVQMVRPCLSRFWGGMFLCVGLALSGLASPVEEAGKLFALGRPAEAAALLDRVVRTNAHSSDLWFNLGQARSQAGEPGRAMVAWRRANRLDPRDGAVRAALEQARQRLGTTGTHPLGQLSGWLRDEEWAALVLARASWSWAARAASLGAPSAPGAPAAPTEGSRRGGDITMP